MKICPYCAEEIQDAAVVCKHCGRDLTAATSVPAQVVVKKKTSGAAWLVLGIIVALVLLVIFSSSDTQTNNGEPLLNISAGRGLLSLQLTNREASPLSDCTASITDSDHTTWVAVVNRTIAPLETVHLYWSSFYSSGGQSMPNYLKERGVIVECLITGLKKTRSAGIGS